MFLARFPVSVQQFFPIAKGPLTRLIYNQSWLIDETGKYQANRGKNVADLTSLSGGNVCVRVDRFVYVEVCRFDLVNGPTLHQLPYCDGDTHKPRHTSTNTHSLRLKGRRNLAGLFIMSPGVTGGCPIDCC